jgi:outer membrane lipoprotein-sorting protein
MIRTLTSTFALLGLLAAAPALTGQAVHAAPAQTADGGFNAAEKQDIQAVQAYLRNIRSLKADFTQIAPNRQVSTGTLSLEKPGKLRFDYDDPSPLLVVSDGTVITLVDYDLRQVTRWPINDTPLKPLVRSNFMFGDDVVVVAMKRNDAWINVAIANPKKRDEGSMLLKFSRNPLKLTEWEVVDERGATTIVSLENLKTNLGLDDALWDFDDPRPQRTGPRTKR